MLYSIWIIASLTWQTCLPLPCLHLKACLMCKFNCVFSIMESHSYTLNNCNLSHAIPAKSSERISRGKSSHANHTFYSLWMWKWAKRQSRKQHDAEIHLNEPNFIDWYTDMQRKAIVYQVKWSPDSQDLSSLCLCSVGQLTQWRPSKKLHHLQLYLPQSAAL